MIAKYNQTEIELTKLIKRDLSQGRDWIMAAQVSHIPFDKNRETYFLLINLNVKPDKSEKDSIIADSLAVAKAIIASEYLSDEKAVEVSVWIDSATSKSPKRIFRLSILDTAFVRALQIKDSDLRNGEFPGITCQWPQQPLT